MQAAALFELLDLEFPAGTTQVELSDTQFRLAVLFLLKGILDAGSRSGSTDSVSVGDPNADIVIGDADAGIVLGN